MGTYHLGNVTVFEVLYVPPNDHYIGMVLDYGNGPVSLLYYLASRHYLECPAPSIVDYAAFIYTSTGQEYLYECGGSMTTFNETIPMNTTLITLPVYAIHLGGLSTVYGLGPAQLGTTLTDLSLGSEGLGMGTELEFVIMVIAVSCVKLLSAHNSTQHTSRKHKV
jgi:hypothetical protein